MEKFFHTLGVQPNKHCPLKTVCSQAWRGREGGRQGVWHGSSIWSTVQSEKTTCSCIQPSHVYGNFQHHMTFNGLTAVSHYGVTPVRPYRRHKWHYDTSRWLVTPTPREDGTVLLYVRLAGDWLLSCKTSWLIQHLYSKDTGLVIQWCKSKGWG